MKNNFQTIVEWLKKFPTWLQTIISLITAILGAIIVLRGNFYLTIILVGAFIAILFLLVSIYVIIIKSPPLIDGGKGVYLYEKYRPLAFICLSTIILIVSSIIVKKETRLFIISAFTGESELSISQVLVSKSNTEYRIEVTINNPSVQDLLVNKISYSLQQGSGGICVDLPPIIYEISDLVSIKSEQKDNIDFQGTVENPNDPEFKYIVTGEFRKNCYEAILYLEFEVSFILPSHSLSNFYLILPKKIFIEDYFTGEKEDVLEYFPVTLPYCLNDELVIHTENQRTITRICKP